MKGRNDMRVYYNANDFVEFPAATHWEACGTDWVELSNDDGEILAVLNWNHVWLMRPIKVEADDDIG